MVIGLVNSGSPVAAIAGWYFSVLVARRHRPAGASQIRRTIAIVAQGDRGEAILDLAPRG